MLFFEHKTLYRTRWPVPPGYGSADHLVPFGQAAVRRAGGDVTVVATLVMLHHALTAAETLAAEGVSVEVIDPRTLVPLDHETIVASVRKTGRLLVVDEAYLPCGIQGEVTAQVTERAFGALRAAPRRLGNPGVPVALRAPARGRSAAGPGTHRRHHPRHARRLVTIAVTETADAVIIGGGIHGASLAFHLTPRGPRPIVVERRTTASVPIINQNKYKENI